MKQLVTSLTCLCFAVCSMAQTTGGTTPGQSAGNDPGIIRDDQKNTASDAFGVLNSVKGAMRAEANKPVVLTEEHYRELITQADNFMAQRKYNDAAVLYNEILQQRDDPYARGRVREVYALREKERLDDAQYRWEAAALSRSRLLSSETARTHAVHFSGAFMSDVSSDMDWTSEAFNMRDPYSDFVAPGKYNDLSLDLQKSIGFTLDGIAVPAETRLIIYENPGCTGKILLDVTGPAIINNGYKVSNKRLKELSSKQFHDTLQSNFPQSVRDWSTANMHEWTKGSLEIRIETKE